MFDHLGVIVNYVILSVHDPEALHGLLSSSLTSQLVLPKSNPPYFTIQTIKDTFQYLHQSHAVQNRSFVNILLKDTKYIVDLIRQIIDKICNSDPYEVLRGVQMVQVLISLCTEELSRGLSDTLTFMLHMVSNLLCKKLSQQHCSITSPYILSILIQFTKVCIEHCPKEFCKYIPVVTKTIVEIKDGNLISDCKGLLEVIFGNEDILKTVISSLDDIPSNETFKQFHDMVKSYKKSSTLFETVNATIDVIRNSGPIEVYLSELESALKKYPDEVDVLYKDFMKSRGFAEDCMRSPVHQLIINLLKLTQHPKQKVS